MMLHIPCLSFPTLRVASQHSLKYFPDGVVFLYSNMELVMMMQVAASGGWIRCKAVR